MSCADTPRLLDSSLRRATRRALWILVCTIPFQGIVHVPGVGTVSKAVGFGVIAIACVEVAVHGRRRRLGDVQLLAVAFTAWVALSYTWSADPQITLVRVLTMVQLCALVLLPWEFAEEPEHLLALVRAFVVGATVTCVSVLTQYDSSGGEAERYTSSGMHPNDVAFVLCLAVPLAWYLSCRSRSRAEILACRAFVPAAALAIVLTASRSAVLIGVVALLIVPVTLREVSRVGRGLVALGLLACLVYGPALLPAPQVERLTTISSEVSDGTLNGRTNLWAVSLEAFAERPLLGAGAGASRLVIGDRLGQDQGAHNTVLSIMVELGMGGLALFGLMVLAVVGCAVRARGLERKLVVVCGLTLLVGLMPRHWEYHKSLWLLAALFAGLAAMPARRVRALATPPLERAGRR